MCSARRSDEWQCCQSGHTGWAARRKELMREDMIIVDGLLVSRRGNLEAWSASYDASI